MRYSISINQIQSFLNQRYFQVTFNEVIGAVHLIGSMVTFSFFLFPQIMRITWIVLKLIMGLIRTFFKSLKEAKVYLIFEVVSFFFIIYFMTYSLKIKHINYELIMKYSLYFFKLSVSINIICEFYTK